MTIHNRCVLIGVAVLLLNNQFAIGAESRRSLLQELANTKPWKNATSDSMKIVEQPFREVIKKDLVNCLQNATMTAAVTTVLSSAITFPIIKLMDVASRSGRLKTDNSDIAKVALTVGCLFGLACGYDVLKSSIEYKYGYYKIECSQEKRIQQAKEQLEENDKLPALSVGIGFTSISSRASRLFYCSNDAENLEQICKRSGLIWTTVNQIKAKSPEVVNLQTKSIKDFYLANSLLSLKSSQGVQDCELDKDNRNARIFPFPESIRRAAINVSKDRGVARQDAKYRKSISDHSFGQVKEYWKEIHPEDQ